MVAAISDIRHFYPEISHQFILNPKIERIRETGQQSVRINGHDGEQGENVCSLLVYPRVGGVPIERTGGLVVSLNLGRKGIRDSGKIRLAWWKVDQAKRSTNDPPGCRRIGKSDLRSKIPPVLLLFEAISTSVGVYDGAQNAKRRINRLQIIVSPIAVLFVVLEV